MGEYSHLLLNALLEFDQTYTHTEVQNLPKIYDIALLNLPYVSAVFSDRLLFHTWLLNSYNQMTMAS